MNWHKKMYVGESVKGKVRYYRFLILHTDKLTGLYCLLSPVNKDDQMEIIRAENLRDPVYACGDQTVLGLAGTRREAYYLAGAMMQDAYRKTGRYSIRQLFGLSETG